MCSVSIWAFWGHSAAAHPRLPLHAEHRGADRRPAAAHHLPHPAHGHPAGGAGLPEPVRAVRALRHPATRGTAPASPLKSNPCCRTLPVSVAPLAGRWHTASWQPILTLHAISLSALSRPSDVTDFSGLPFSMVFPASKLAFSHSSTRIYSHAKALAPTTLPSFTYWCNSHLSADAGEHGYKRRGKASAGAGKAAQGQRCPAQ